MHACPAWKNLTHAIHWMPVRCGLWDCALFWMRKPISGRQGAALMNSCVSMQILPSNLAFHFKKGTVCSSPKGIFRAQIIRQRADNCVSMPSIRVTKKELPCLRPQAFHEGQKVCLLLFLVLPHWPCGVFILVLMWQHLGWCHMTIFCFSVRTYVAKFTDWLRVPQNMYLKNLTGGLHQNLAPGRSKNLEAGLPPVYGRLPTPKIYQLVHAQNVVIRNLSAEEPLERM